MLKIRDRVILNKELEKDGKDYSYEEFIIGQVYGDKEEYDYDIVKGNEIFQVYEDEVVPVDVYPNHLDSNIGVDISAEKINEWIKELLETPEETVVISSGNTMVIKAFGRITVAKNHKEMVI